MERLYPSLSQQEALERLKSTLIRLGTGNATDRKALVRLENKIGLPVSEILAKLDYAIFCEEFSSKLLKDKKLLEQIVEEYREQNIRDILVRMGMTTIAIATFLIAHHVGDIRTADMALGVGGATVISGLVKPKKAK